MGPGYPVRLGLGPGPEAARATHTEIGPAGPGQAKPHARIQPGTSCTRLRRMTRIGPGPEAGGVTRAASRARPDKHPAASRTGAKDAEWPSRPVRAPTARMPLTAASPAHMPSRAHSPDPGPAHTPLGLPARLVTHYEFSARTSHPARSEGPPGRPGPSWHVCSWSAKQRSKPWLRFKPPMAGMRHAMGVGGNAGLEPRTSGYRALRCAKCARCPAQSKAHASYLHCLTPPRATCAPWQEISLAALSLRLRSRRGRTSKGP